MNKIVSKLYIALLATLVTLLSACTPETYELGSQDIVSDDLAEGIAFSTGYVYNITCIKYTSFGFTNKI